MNLNRTGKIPVRSLYVNSKLRQVRKYANQFEYRSFLNSDNSVQTNSFLITHGSNRISVVWDKLHDWIEAGQVPCVGILIFQKLKLFLMIFRCLGIRNCLSQWKTASFLQSSLQFLIVLLKRLYFAWNFCIELNLRWFRGAVNNID